MSSSSSWAPNEPHSAIIQEEVWLQGSLLSNFLFGIQTILAILAFLAVLRGRTSTDNFRLAILIYTIVLSVITTLAQGLTIEWIQMGFITQRNYPGGPSAFFGEQWAIPISVAENILSVLSNWMMEALLVWRCYVICSTGGRLWWFGVAIPFGLLIGVFVTGSLFIDRSVKASLPTGFILAYSIFSLALNVTATAFIAGRLLVHQRQVTNVLGKGFGHFYTSLVAVVVESAAIYTTFVLVTIVVYAIGSPGSIFLQMVILQVQTIASLLIIWRVARGEGWSKSNNTAMTVSSFNARIVPQSELSAIYSTRPEGEVDTRQREYGNEVSLPAGSEV